jgi:predicted nuclease of predicted toxin-antitoxin system
VRLLFDQNLSPRLAEKLGDLYPGSAHVRDYNLSCAPDNDILDLAERDGFVLVSKDSDFFDPGLIRQRSAKIVWIRRGNCSTADVEHILRRHHMDIAGLDAAGQVSLLMLF